MSNDKPKLNGMAAEFTPRGMAQPTDDVNQIQSMLDPVALQSLLASPDAKFLQQMQQQQLQQLQQLHQQNMRLAAAFSRSQAGIYNALLASQQVPGQSRGKPVTVAEQTNSDFEHFPTREVESPPAPQVAYNNSNGSKSQYGKESNKDSAFDDISDDSSDSNGSSFVTADLDASEIPDGDVLMQICVQVEEYLSDCYLATDKYLLRQLRSKSEGYLSVKLLTSFKKIKKLTRDWRVTSFALRMSSKVELSTDGNRVKRVAHLPDNLRRGRTMTSILAIRVPDDWATLEVITNIFSAYGNITLARVLRPGRPIPPDLRNYATQIPDMGATTCAVVDFDSTDSAHECCRGLRDQNLRGMRIALLGPRIRRTLYKSEKKKMPETGPDTRKATRRNIVQEQLKNVSKEEGLKIIQSYFQHQNQPVPDDQMEFPPLGMPPSNSQDQAHIEQKMKEMSLNQPKMNPSKWPLPNQKPSMSQIVANSQRNPLESDTSEDSAISQKSGGQLGWSSAQGGAESWSPWSTSFSFDRRESNSSAECDFSNQLLKPPCDIRFDQIPSVSIGDIWSNNGKAGPKW